MKIELFDPSAEKADKVLRLRLRQATSGRVRLEIVDEAGKRVHKGNVLSIDPDGILRLAFDINTDYGLVLDNTGRLIPAQV